MATQGILSLVDKDTKEVLWKVIAGCNGMKVKHLMDIISFLPRESISISKLLKASKDVSLGCDECLVVMNKEHAMIMSGEDLVERYRDTFSDKDFNPRWERGTADYSEILYI